MILIQDTESGMTAGWLHVPRGAEFYGTVLDRFITGLRQREEEIRKPSLEIPMEEQMVHPVYQTAYAFGHVPRAGMIKRAILARRGSHLRFAMITGFFVQSQRADNAGVSGDFSLNLTVQAVEFPEIHSMEAVGWIMGVATGFP